MNIYNRTEMLRRQDGALGKNPPILGGFEPICPSELKPIPKVAQFLNRKYNGGGIYSRICECIADNSKGRVRSLFQFH